MADVIHAKMDMFYLLLGREKAAVRRSFPATVPRTNSSDYDLPHTSHEGH